MTTHFDEYEELSRSLQLISKSLNNQSSEYLALEKAGLALAFVTIHHPKAFQEFLADWEKGELSAEQLSDLKRRGLE